MHPPQFRELVGEEAEAIMAAFGGRLAYVPYRWRGSALAAKIGERAAQRLSAEFAGETIWIPAGRQSPYLQCRELIRSGMSVREARRAVRCSNTTAYKASRDLRASAR